MNRYPYFCCDGGPHLVLPKALASSWSGVRDARDALDPSTDYGRACAIGCDAAVIEVGTGHALVLGESPPMTSWAPLDGERGLDLFVLHEWHGQDLDGILDEVRTAVAASAVEAAFQWRVPAGGAALLFAGDTVADSVYGVHDLPLTGGHYRAHVVTLDVTMGIALVCRLVRG